MPIDNSPGRPGGETPGKPPIVVEPDKVKPCIDLLLNVVEGSRQAFIIANTSGHIVGCNAAFCRLTGYSRDELLAMKGIGDLTPPEWRKNEAGVIAGQVKSRMPAIYHKEYIRKDGARVFVELYNQVMFDRAGRPLYFYAFIDDLTGRK